MSDGRRTIAESGEVSAGDRIDLLCDAFEREWQAGGRPRIEDYLVRTTAPDRSTLVVELVKVDAEYRRRIGEQPRAHEYVQRFPAHADQLSGCSLVTTAEVERRLASLDPVLLADFEILEQLGEGAYGTVWKARDLRLDRVVALKLPRSAAEGQGGSAALVREGRAAAGLRHPNIVGIYEISTAGDAPYIVSEFIDGPNLKQWATAVRPTAQEAANVCAKLADALEHAHNCGIVHRDLKPANILMDRSGEPHVTDFGLAKRISTDATVTADGQILGTPAYMSPEQAAGESGRVDARSDVFSLGAILYELLTGTRPFEGDGLTVLRRVLTQNPVRPRALDARIPRNLETICLHALAKDPADRYATAGAMAEDLRRAVGGQRIRARWLSMAWNRERLSRREFVVASASAAGAASLFLSGRMAGWWNSPETATAATAPKPRPIRLATSPPGARIVVVPVSDVDGTPQPERLVDAGRSPVSLELEPGDYWIVADLEGYGFHEVMRHVPFPGERPSDRFRHQTWWPQSRHVELKGIEIPPQTIEETLVQFPGGRNLRMGSPEVPGTIVHHRTVLPFFADASLFTSGDYKKIAEGMPFYRLIKHGPSDSSPLVMISFDEAMHLAELAGMRLLDEWEYEHAASLSVLNSSGPSLDGSNAGLAEWTNAWPNQPPYRSQSSEPIHDLRIVRGAIANFSIEPRHAAPGNIHPFRRLAVDRGLLTARGLSFRCARSVRPRTEMSDWHQASGIRV